MFHVKQKNDLFNVSRETKTASNNKLEAVFEAIKEVFSLFGRSFSGNYRVFASFLL